MFVRRLLNRTDFNKMMRVFVQFTRQMQYAIMKLENTHINVIGSFLFIIFHMNRNNSIYILAFL